MKTTTAKATRRLKDLPGPRGWPLLGNVLQITPTRIHLDLECWASAFGPLFRVRLAGSTLLVIADHELLAEVMRDRPDGFGRIQLNRGTGKQMDLTQGVFYAEGDDWRKQRRMVTASFAPGHVRAYLPSLVTVTLRLRSRWLKAVRAGASIPLQADLMRFTVDTISGLAFGKDINTLEAGDDICQVHLEKVLKVRFRRLMSMVPYWRWFKLKSDRDFDHSVAVINATVRDYVAQARQRLRDDPTPKDQPRNLLEAMIMASDEPDSGIDDQHVAGNVLTLLIGGEDTTANTLLWMIYLLHRNPDALRRAQQEVLSVAPDPASYSMEHMERLVFLEACANESMRLKPVVPFTLLEALRDTVVGDVAVPRGTKVCGLFRHDSVSERWFERPEAFEPQRWLEEGPHPLTVDSKRAMMAFGSGPRVCPGRYLALLEIKMAMAMLLSTFDIEAVDTPDGGPAEEHSTFTMQPVGLRLRLRERQAR